MKAIRESNQGLFDWNACTLNDVFVYSVWLLHHLLKKSAVDGYEERLQVLFPELNKKFRHS